MKHLLYVSALAATLMMSACSESDTQRSTNSGTADSGESSDASSDTSSNNDGGTNAGADTGAGAEPVDTGTTTGAGTGGTDTDDTGSNDNSGASNPPVATCSNTDVGIAFQAINATLVSDVNYSPDNLLDGCTDRAHSWSGDKGSIVTLDAGAVHQIQGVYIWSSFARMEWLKLESSVDGLNWATDWHALPTKPVDGPVYYGLAEPGSKRYIRITGYGSIQSDWTNLTEVRWSSLGYNVQGQRGLLIPWKDPGNNYSGPGTQRTAAIGTYETTDLRLNVVRSAASANQYLINTCGQYPVMNWYATGHMDKFFTVFKMNGLDNYIFDFDHYDGNDAHRDSLNPAPKQFEAMSDQYWEDHGRAAQDGDTCPNTYNDDIWYNVGYAWGDYQRGHLQPITLDQFQ